MELASGTNTAWFNQFDLRRAGGPSLPFTTPAPMPEGGTGNLVPNPSSELTHPPEASLAAVGLTNVTGSLPTSFAPSGYCRAITGRAGVGEWLVATAGCRPGESFTAQARGAMGGSGNVRLLMRFLDGSGNPVHGQYSDGLSNNTLIHTLAVAGTAPKAAVSVELLLTMGLASGTNTAWFNHLDLRRAGTAPAPGVDDGNLVANASSLMIDLPKGSPAAAGLANVTGSLPLDFAPSGHCRAISATATPGYLTLASVPCHPGEVYSARALGAMGGSGHARLLFRFQSASGAAVLEQYSNALSNDTNINTVAGTATAPEGAASVQLLLSLEAVTGSNTAWFNHFMMRRR
jgi:hypothetical protein